VEKIERKDGSNFSVEDAKRNEEALYWEFTDLLLGIISKHHW